MSRDADMPPRSFVHWWFAPWDRGDGQQGWPRGRPGRLGRRDGYRRWCAQAAIPAALPARGAARWAALAVLPPGELLAAARLFGGLFAVRTPLAQAHDGLDANERRWCAALASVQPLPAPPWRTRGLAECGLAWLALCLERDVPGMWPRLALGLPAELTQAVSACLAARQGVDDGPGEAGLHRVRRCWDLCLRRAADDRYEG